MNPTRRISVAIIFALLAGAVISLSLPVLGAALADQRSACLDSGPTGLVAQLCTVVVRHPYRLPLLLSLVMITGLAGVSLLVARWCVGPLDELTAVVEQLGPTNLGHRTGMQGRRDALGRLGRGMDAMLDRIATGYDSQRRFAADASHELRTPLAVQRTLIEVGLAEPLSAEQLELLTTQLLRTNERNERLIEGLLTLAEAEQSPVPHSPQQLDEIARTVVEAHQPRAAAATVTLSVDATPTLVRGERVLVERLITNLVQNAIAYNVPGGTVEVSVRPSTLVVANTGRMVPAHEVNTLFEPFRRGSGDRLTHSGGAGLGLAITRAIATAHDAVITAVPGPDGGLVVQVEFVAAAARERP